RRCDSFFRFCGYSSLSPSLRHPLLCSPTMPAIGCAGTVNTNFVRGVSFPSCLGNGGQFSPPKAERRKSRARKTRRAENGSLCMSNHVIEWQLWLVLCGCLKFRLCYVVLCPQVVQFRDDSADPEGAASPQSHPQQRRDRQQSAERESMTVR